MGLSQAYQLDDLDLQILDILIKDCRTPYLEIARLCHVSGGTIHVRMKKMEELGIIKGTKILLNLPKLGYDVCCFVGIYIDKTSSFSEVFDEMSKIKEVVDILLNKINVISGIQRTDTIISLNQPIDRNISI